MGYVEELRALVGHRPLAPSLEYVLAQCQLAVEAPPRPPRPAP